MDGSCVRLRAERPNHVWSYDFVHDRTHDGRAYRTLNIIDDYTREALMIRVDRKLNSTDVVDARTDLFILRGAPEYIRSDNDRSSLPRKYVIRSPLWVPRRPTLNQVHHGKTASVRALMLAFEMSC
jgi:transposase InsO family protein